MASRASIEFDDVYELPESGAAEPIPAEWQSTAAYTLEMAVRCPHCDEAIRTIRIVGLTRSQVALHVNLTAQGPRGHLS